MASKAVTSREPGAGAIVAALLLPPLGVFLVRGIGPAFWIAAVLTCFGIMPGALFALVALFKPDLLPNRPST